MIPGPNTTPPELNLTNAVPSQTEHLASIKPDEPGETLNMANDQPLFRWDDETRRPLSIGIPVEPAPMLEPESAEKSQSVSDFLLSKLDEMTASLEEAMDVSQKQHALVARITALTGATLSTGLVAWALRSSTLLASCLATMPAWRHFDPLPVLRLGRRERERQRKEAEQDRQEEATEFNGLKKLLGLSPPLKPKP